MKKSYIYFSGAILIVIMLLSLQGCEKEAEGIQYGFVSDIEGNEYRTVTIGTQEWMADNLRTTKYNDGTDISLVTNSFIWQTLETPGYAIYAIDDFEVYGYLYNWYVVNTCKVCPSGWHVPSDEEWSELIDYLVVNGYNSDGTQISNSVAKSLAAKDYWSESDTDGAPGNNLSLNNSTGFSAVGGGYRDDFGRFQGFNAMGKFWSSTLSEYPTSAYYYNISYNTRNVLRHTLYITNGFSIRCVKD